MLRLVFATMLLAPVGTVRAQVVTGQAAASQGGGQVRPAVPRDSLGDAERRQMRRSPVVRVYEQSKDAVVNISTKQVIRVRGVSDVDRLFGIPREQTRTLQTTAVGSGFVIHPAGYIVTNAHVVARTIDRKCLFPDGREFDAEIIAMDVEGDLAVLKIDAPGPLPTLPFAPAGDLLIGETVVAIGNPLGLQTTVTAGVVSAVDRSIDVDEKRSFDGLIQTDASINPGNSGGPLLNVFGELIGVNTAIRGDAQNIGFAIPVAKLAEALPVMLDVERLHRIETGLALDDGVPPTVTGVQPGSPAAAAGLRPGDALTLVDSQPLRMPADFPIALIGKQAGDNVDLRFRRGGQLFRANLTLKGKPLPDGAALAKRMLGVDLDPLPENVAARLGLRNQSGLVVVKVEDDGPADRAGIEPGDVLLQMDRSPTNRLDDLGLFLEDVSSGQKLAVGLLRLGRYIPVRLFGEVTAR